MPPASEIQVYKLSDLPKFGFIPKETVIACALPPDKLFFREIPPTKYDLAHELIHLCRKHNIVHEEVYGYNLAPIVLFCAKEQLFNINIFKIFELTKEQVNKVLQKYGYESIDDFYLQQGVIPLTHKLVPSEHGLKVVRDERYSETDIVITFLAEVTGGLQYESICSRIIKDLLLTYITVEEIIFIPLSCKIRLG